MRSGAEGASQLRTAAASTTGSWAAAASALALWAVSSSVMILGHKIVLVDRGFPFPLTLTAVEQLCSGLAGWALSASNIVKIGRPPELRSFVSRILPCVLSFAGTLYLGNASYLSLSVSFIQMLKAMVPAITLVLLLSCGMERFSLSVAISVAAITFGTSLTAIMEVGTATFDLTGFLMFAASAILEAVRVVLVQLLMSNLKYNAAEVLLFVGLPTGICLTAAAVVSESKDLLQYGWRAALRMPGLLAMLMISSVAVNVSTCLSIRLTSSLTFKTAGCLKNAAVIMIGVLSGDVVSGTQIIGYAIAVGGFANYVNYQQMKLRQGVSDARIRKTS